MSESYLIEVRGLKPDAAFEEIALKLSYLIEVRGLKLKYHEILTETEKSYLIEVRGLKLFRNVLCLIINVERYVD